MYIGFHNVDQLFLEGSRVDGLYPGVSLDLPLFVHSTVEWMQFQRVESFQPYRL